MFQAWILSTCEVGADRTFMAELQQLLFPWRDIEILSRRHGHALSENSELFAI